MFFLHKKSHALLILVQSVQALEGRGQICIRDFDAWSSSICGGVQFLAYVFLAHLVSRC